MNSQGDQTYPEPDGIVAHVVITSTAAYKDVLEVLARHRQEAWIDYEQSRYSFVAEKIVEEGLK